MTKQFLIANFKQEGETEEEFLKTVPPILYNFEECAATEQDLKWAQGVFDKYRKNIELNKSLKKQDDRARYTDGEEILPHITRNLAIERRMDLRGPGER
jgi:hypothetical protein